VGLLAEQVGASRVRLALVARVCARERQNGEGGSFLASASILCGGKLKRVSEEIGRMPKIDARTEAARWTLAMGWATSFSHHPATGNRTL